MAKQKNIPILRKGGPAPGGHGSPALTYGKGPQISPVQAGRVVVVDVDDWIRQGFWVTVVSSNVAAIAYDDWVRDLFVEFDDGSVYKYTAVPEQIARNMFNASSMGKFRHQVLSRFGYRKLR